MVRTGFIMLFRDFVDWEWYTDVNTCDLFLHFLIKANNSKKRWQGILIAKDVLSRLTKNWQLWKNKCFGDMLSDRSANKLRTFAKCNFTKKKKCVEQILMDLGHKYGEPINDRIFEMFNILVFAGVSFRR